jgi:ABC-type transport system involved in multi-copper enzyme maturation permease subunit
VSISGPRYSAGPIRLEPRWRRALAVYARGVASFAGWGTWIVVALTYLIIVIIIVLTAEFDQLGSAGISVGTFHSAYVGSVWSYLALLVATAVASGSVAEDLASRSITLYLSRPIRLEDYLGAKLAAVGTWLAVCSVGPGVVGVTIVAGLGLCSASVSLGALGAFVAIGLLTTVFFTGFGVALSALTGRAVYAGVGIFGFCLAAEIAAAAVQGVTGNASVGYISPIDDIFSASQAAFRTGASVSVDPWAAAGILVAASLALVAVTWLRLQRVEVVAE